MGGCTKGMAVSEPVKLKYRHINFTSEDDEAMPVRLRHYKCRNNKSGDILAEVRYYTAWRKFVVNFDPGCIFDNTCLADIQDFLGQLNNLNR